MANIESVKLPDGTQYDIKDAVSGYTSKVTGATNGNFAALDSNGDLTDSGHKHSDYLSGVDVSTATNGQALIYNGGTSKWENQNISQTLSGLTDTTITTPANKELLQYDSANSKWANNGDIPNSVEAIVNVYCSKNLNSYPYMQTTLNEHGVTFTDNGDGTITASGTASSADASITLHGYQTANANSTILKNGTYIISGCPQGGSDSTYYIRAFTVDSNMAVQGEVKEYGNGVTFTVNGSYESADWARINLSIIVKDGTTLGTPGITFYPMIRDARITDDTFVPYAMTNRELTEKNILKSITVGSTPSITINKRGEVCSIYASLSSLSSTSDTVSIGTISDPDFLPSENYAIIPVYSTTSGPYAPISSMWISKNGLVSLYKPTTVTSVYVCGNYLTK